MGKAEIISNDDYGYYTIRVVYNDQRAKDTIQHLRDRASEIDDKLYDFAQKRDDAESELNDASKDLNQAINEYRDARGTEDEPDKRQALLEAQKTFIKARAEYSQAASEYEMWRLEKTSAERRIRLIERYMPAGQEFQTACADYSTELSGTVGTIEPLGLGQEVRIRPGYEDGAAYSEGRDGQMTPIIAQTAAQTLYNYMMLPGWQKWQPLHRIGRMTSLDRENVKCDVELDAATSPAQDLKINQENTLSGVPITYMLCDANAFQSHDRVLVEFQGQDWQSPQVIGFAAGPEPCPLVLSLTINGYTPKRAHRIGFFDAETGELIDSAWSDQSGVVYDRRLAGYDPGQIIPGIWHEGGDLFAHFMEDSEGFYFRSGYEAYNADFEPPDEYLEDGQYYYRWSAGRGDTAPGSDAENADTLYLTQVEWFLLKQTLADMSKDFASRYNGDPYHVYEVDFTGLKVPYATADTRHGGSPLSNFKDFYHSLQGCGELIQDFWKANSTPEIVFDRGSQVYVDNSSASGNLYSGNIHLGPRVFGDTYKITFQDAENFTLRGLHEETYLGVEWRVVSQGNIKKFTEVHRPIGDAPSPILSIDPDGWSGPFQAGDEIHIYVSLGKFTLTMTAYDGSETVVEATTEEDVHVDTSAFSLDLERPAWAGVFYAEDHFFAQRPWKSGTVGPYCDPLSGDRVASDIGPYGGQWRGTGYYSKPLNEFQLDYIPRVNKDDDYSPPLWLSAQDYTQEYSTRDIVPLTTARDESPTMPGATIRLKIQATQDSDGNWCGQFLDVDRIDFELRDTPPEVI